MAALPWATFHLAAELSAAPALLLALNAMSGVVLTRVLMPLFEVVKVAPGNSGPAWAVR